MSLRHHESVTQRWLKLFCFRKLQKFSGSPEVAGARVSLYAFRVYLLCVGLLMGLETHFCWVSSLDQCRNCCLAARSWSQCFLLIKWALSSAVLTHSYMAKISQVKLASPENMPLYRRHNLAYCGFVVGCCCLLGFGFFWLVAVCDKKRTQLWS